VTDYAAANDIENQGISDSFPGLDAGQTLRSPQTASSPKHAARHGGGRHHVHSNTYKPMTRNCLMMLAAGTVLVAGCSDQVTDAAPTDVTPAAASVTPVTFPGNPRCADLIPGSFEFKPQPEPPPGGSYTSPDGLLSLTIGSDGTYFDWTADLVLVGVFVKGGAGGNLYLYDAGAKSDRGLHSPINPSNGQPYAISHLSFCYTSDAIILRNLKVEKDATTRRTWSWTIDKSADATELSVAEGQLLQVNYDVAVSASAEDVVSGVITIRNTNDGLNGGNAVNEDIRINTVADVVTATLAATVECAESLPHVLAATEALQCRYRYPRGASAPPAGNNVAHVNATRVASASSGLTDDFANEPPVPWSFDPPAVEIDECVDVNDSAVGALGTVCASNAPKTFTYSLRFGNGPGADVQLVCGDNTLTNTASLQTSDYGVTRQDDWTVRASQACAPPAQQGCTLTQGYWQTHADVGNAKKYNRTWELVGGPGAPFFSSGKSYLQTLNTPTGGNVYYTLAHQYIATKLNRLSGASTPSAVLDAFEAATDLFEATTPAQAVALKGTARNEWVTLATVLDRYNNGIVGPGHCTE
jgi:hypothetical protein